MENGSVIKYNNLGKPLLSAFHFMNEMNRIFEDSVVTGKPVNMCPTRMILGDDRGKYTSIKVICKNNGDMSVNATSHKTEYGYNVRMNGAEPRGECFKRMTRKGLL